MGTPGDEKLRLKSCNIENRILMDCVKVKPGRASKGLRRRREKIASVCFISQDLDRQRTSQSN